MLSGDSSADAERQHQRQQKAQVGVGKATALKNCPFGAVNGGFSKHQMRVDMLTKLNCWAFGRRRSLP